MPIKGSFAKSHNIWVQSPESHFDNTIQGLDLPFVDSYYSFLPPYQIIHIQKILLARSTISTFS